MGFWGIEIKPGKPYRHLPTNNAKGKLLLTQATVSFVSATPPKSTVTLQCNVGDKSPVYLCSFYPKTSMSFSLSVELEEEEDVVLSVIGPGSVHLVGRYLESSRDRNDSESIGDDVNDTGSETEEEDDDEGSLKDNFIVDDDEGSLKDSFIVDDDEGSLKDSFIVDDEEVPSSKDASFLKGKRKCQTIVSSDESQDNETAGQRIKKKKMSGSYASDSASEGDQNDVIVEVLKVKGEGKVAVAGKKVTVKYSGKIKESGEVFEFSDNGFPKKFRLGKGKVVKGLEMGIEGMTVGEKRSITVPPSLGYAEEGNGDVVPPNSWLIYEVELLKVR